MSVQGLPTAQAHAMAYRRLVPDIAQASRALPGLGVVSALDHTVQHRHKVPPTAHGCERQIEVGDVGAQVFKLIDRHAQKRSVQDQ